MEFKLEIYAPETEVVAIRDVLNSVGAGVVGDYDSVILVDGAHAQARRHEYMSWLIDKAEAFRSQK